MGNRSNESQVDLTDGSGASALGAAGTRSLYLDTLRPGDDIRGGGRRKPVPGRRADDPLAYGPLSTQGIDRARSESLYRFTNKPEIPWGLAKQFEEKGMHPRELHPARANRPSFNLTVKDIDGTSSRPKDVIKVPRGTNPLDPDYRLPAYDHPKVEPPAFRRDGLKVDDIDGAKAAKIGRPLMRETMLTADIEGAQVGRPRRASSASRASLDVRDINNPARQFVYPAWDPVEGSKPRPQTRERVAAAQDSSLRNDIEGARPRSTATGLPAGVSRRHFRAINCVQDIPGASARPGQGGAAPGAGATPIPARERQAGMAGQAGRMEGAQALLRERLTASGEAAPPPGAPTPRAISRNLIGLCKEMDRDNSGKLSSAEFQRVVKRSNLPLQSVDMDQVVKGFDTDASGFLDYRAFNKFAIPLLSQKRREGQLQPAGGAKPLSPKKDQKKAEGSERKAAHGGEEGPASTSSPTTVAGQRQKENRKPARAQSARSARHRDPLDYGYKYVTSDMAVAGKASYKDGEAARKHKRPPSVRSTAQKISINSMSNIAPEEPEWRPSSQAMRGRTAPVADPAMDFAEAEAEHPVPTETARPRPSPARRPGSAAGAQRSGARGRPAHSVQWKAAAKPRPMSAGDITRLKRSYKERQADIAAVAALK